MWTTGSRAWERELVAECEAFVSGHYAQYLGERPGSRRTGRNRRPHSRRTGLACRFGHDRLARSPSVSGAGTRRPVDQAEPLVGRVATLNPRSPCTGACQATDTIPGYDCVRRPRAQCHRSTPEQPTWLNQPRTQLVTRWIALWARDRLHDHRPAWAHGRFALQPMARLTPCGGVVYC